MRYLSIILLLLLLIGCTPKPKDARLFRISDMCASSPRDALDSLEAIDAGELSEADRHFYDFLFVKVADKSFVPHTSDSLIKCVIDYESKNRSLGRYVESLYYGGRVYSDLGDFPTALHYFQDALDQVGTDESNIKLRANILGQLALLLNKLHLYEEAMPYLKEVLEIDRILNDSVNAIYDMHLLGYGLMTTENYNQADSIFSIALTQSRNLTTKMKAKSSMYKAAVKYYKGELDSARLYIYNIVDSVAPLARNSVLAYGARIFFDSEKYDSAYLYAQNLIHSPDLTNKHVGYHTLLSPELINRLHTDTIFKYYHDYLLFLDQFLDENQNRLAIDRRSQYNYNKHQRDREIAENRNIIFKNTILMTLIVNLSLCCVIFWLKNLNNKHKIQLHEALENISRLEQSLNRGIHSSNNKILNNELITMTDLRGELRNKLLNIYFSGENTYTIPSEIINSKPYIKLQEYIKNCKELKEDNTLWSELEDMICRVSPNFKSNLMLLVGGKLNSFDLHTSILIRCGVSPTQMTKLLNRAKGTITSRRESIGLRVFDQKTATKVVDGIIRLL